MSDQAYESDALSWAEHQAGLLRRLAAGERLNESIDWPRVIDEVQDVGLSELRACQSLLRQAIVHLLKLCAWPTSQAVPHWRGETVGFLADARDRFTPSMRQRIDLADIYAAAVQQVETGGDVSGEPNSLAACCPYELDELLARKVDLPALVERLTRA